jgi:large subunit ribosomal protein L9
MKVLFIADVANAGRKGEVKEISDGFARNFLLPKGFAVQATEQLVSQVKKEQKEKILKLERERKEQEKIANLLRSEVVAIKAKSGNKHLFAAVNRKQVSDAIAKRFNLEIDPDKIEIKNPIKDFGKANVFINLSNGNKTLIHLDIQPE